MKSITIQGTKRESVGKKATKALRNADLVPCVVYGEGEPLHFSAEERAFEKLVYTPDAHTATLEIEGKKINAILQDIQFHPISDKILHADFYELSESKPVTMEIPVRLEGRSRGVVAGGVLSRPFRRLTVRALPADLPDEIVVNITSLRIGQKIYVGDLDSSKYTFLHPDNAVVVAVRTSRVAVDDSDDDEEEEGAEGTAEAAAEGGEAAAADNAEA